MWLRTLLVRFPNLDHECICRYVSYRFLPEYLLMNHFAALRRILEKSRKLLQCAYRPTISLVLTSRTVQIVTMSAASVNTFDRWFSQLAWYGQKHLYFTSSFWWRLDLLWQRLLVHEEDAIFLWLDLFEMSACLAFGISVRNAGSIIWLTQR